MKRKPKMITFPANFIATHWPGYFFNQDDNTLYSIKSGQLKPLARQPAFQHHRTGFRISVNGRKVLAELEYLKVLKPVPYVIPVAGAPK